jgi:hypothetical protein
MDAEHALLGHRDGIGPVGVRLDVQVAVPADQYRSEADEGMQQRDQLGHARHLDDPSPPEPDGRADRHGAEQQSEAQRFDLVVDGQRDGRDERDRHAHDAEADAGAGRLVPGQSGQGEDEEQCCHDVGRGRSSFQGQHGEIGSDRLGKL